MKANNAVKFLRNKEWSMGNGQCPECCGVPASWHGHPCHMTTEGIGHEANCSLAAALVAVGDTPLMKGTFKSNAEFEHYISDGGFFGTRPKTAKGCPKYQAWSRKLKEAIDREVLASLSA